MKKLFIALVAFAISFHAVAEDQFSVSTGFDFSSGKYGNVASTNILYIPITGKYEFDDFTIELTIPHITITGPGGVVQGIGRLGKPVTRTTKSTNSGLGDITTSAGYTVYSGDSLSLDLVGNIKFGTADAKKGLGTGRNDYSTQLDSYYTLDETTLFATAGYKVYGAPAGTKLNSAPYGTIGASQKLDEVTVGAMLDVTKSTSTTSQNQREATVYISQKISTSLKVQANAMKGFSTSSPDFGGGIMITGDF